MKKAIFTVFILTILSGAVFADKYVPVSELPASITDFMKTYFPTSTITDAEYDDGKYEITFSTELENDNTKQFPDSGIGKAQFSRRGDWDKIEFYLGIPENLLPENVLSTLKESFPDKAIVFVERERRSFELTLSDNTELEISDEGKILDHDSDDKRPKHKKFMRSKDKKMSRD